MSSFHCVYSVHPFLCLVTAEGLAFGLPLQQIVSRSLLYPNSNVLEFVVALDPWCFNRNRETLADQFLSKTSYFDRNSLHYDHSQLFLLIPMPTAQPDTSCDTLPSGLWGPRTKRPARVSFLGRTWQCHTTINDAVIALWTLQDSWYTRSQGEI